jgi:hypothetical protein
MMKLATMNEEERPGMRPGRETAIFLEEVKGDEPANMTDQDGWRAMEHIESWHDAWDNPAAIGGWIAPSALLAKLRK